MFDLKESDLPELKRLAGKGFKYIARDENSKIFAYKQPIRRSVVSSSWSFDIPSGWSEKRIVDSFQKLDDGFFANIDWSDPEPLNIAAAIAQIKAQSHAKAKEMPLTVNDWLNQASVEEKTKWFMTDGERFFAEACECACITEHDYNMIQGGVYEGAWYERYKRRMTELLTSPYKEATND